MDMAETNSSREAAFAADALSEALTHAPDLEAVLGPDMIEAIVERATEVIGNRQEALRWMGTPIRALDYSTPVDLLGDEPGRLKILDVLGRLEHGVL